MKKVPFIVIVAITLLAGCSMLLVGVWTGEDGNTMTFTDKTVTEVYEGAETVCNYTADEKTFILSECSGALEGLLAAGKVDYTISGNTLTFGGHTFTMQ